MNDVNTRPIVVGIGAEGESDGALRFAVEEAIQQSCAITVVHAVSASFPPPDPFIVTTEWTEQDKYFADHTTFADAERLVTAAVHQIHELGRGRIAVDAYVPSAHKVHAIVEASEQARLVVVQHRDLPFFERIFMRSVSVGVSSRAHCPVVTVPSSWNPDLHFNRVTVGLDNLDGATDVLRLGFEEAVRRSVKLDVVHAMEFFSAEASGPEFHTLMTERKTHAVRDLSNLLAPWQREHPNVQVEQHTSELDAGNVLLAHSQESDLLILGHRRTRFPLPLGTVARAMVKGAHCPIKIVPYQAAARKAGTERATEVST